MVPHEISHVIVLWNPQDEMNNRQQEMRRIFTEAPMTAMAASVLHVADPPKRVNANWKNRDSNKWSGFLKSEIGQIG